jgi:exosortase/archaeosortase family protein
MERGGWPARVWLRIAVATGLFAIAAWLAEGSPEITRVLAPAAVSTARVVEFVLVCLGMNPRRELATLTDSTGFSYQIDLACTGVIPAGLLVVSILISQASLRAKLWGVAIGAPCTVALNLARLVNLFYIGVRYPHLFFWVHSPLWEGLMVAFLVGFFLVWKLSGSREV